MSKTELKVVENGEQNIAAAQESKQATYEFTEELLPVSVDVNSIDARIAGLEYCSVAYEIRKHCSSMAAFDVEQENLRRKQENLPPLTYEEEDAMLKEAWQRHLRKKKEDYDEHLSFLRRRPVRYLDWGELRYAWNESPADAADMWREIRLEARDEFLSGHYGARSFESLPYMQDPWHRAQYLAVRDGLIEEWKPRGASEIILIDQMTQSYVMGQYWTEQAMLRAQTAPRSESYEFQEWKRHCKLEAKYNQWGPGDWDIPSQGEAAAVEQAFKLAELCQKAYQRAARQLANIRLIRAKTNRARRRERTKAIKTIKVA